MLGPCIHSTAIAAQMHSAPSRQLKDWKSLNKVFGPYLEHAQANCCCSKHQCTRAVVCVIRK
jgi:hypothetical protein